MKLMLERRAEQSRSMAYLSPIIAITLTVIAGGIIFAARGLDPLHALFVYFVEPVTTLSSSQFARVSADFMDTTTGQWSRLHALQVA